MPAILDEARTGNSVADLKQAILDNLYYIQGRVPALATPTDWYMALAYAVRDRMMKDWIKAIHPHAQGETSRSSDIFRRSFLSVRSWGTICSISASANA